MTVIDVAWPEALAAALARAPGAARAAVLVAVAEARGSTPREAGAAMVVTPEGITGTIGGGHLEYEASRLAREALGLAGETLGLAGETRGLAGETRGLARVPPGLAQAAPRLDEEASGLARAAIDDAAAAPSWLVRFPLAARLGQCCGGVATLAFHVVGPADVPWVAAARDAHRRGATFALVARTGSAERSIVVDQPFPAAAARDDRRGADRVPADDGRAAADAPLVLIHRPSGFDVAVFGNGHVGRALVRVLGALPARVRWIDSREHDFPSEVPANVDVVATDTPDDELAALPPGSYVVVLTHSHALDFDLVEAALARDDWAYLGLIGSTSKRAQFARRLAARGHAGDTMARIVCPIGATAGLTGKEPGVIAVAVAAELLARREARARAAATRTGAQIAPLHADGIAAGAGATREQRA